MANNQSVGSNTYESILKQTAGKKSSVFSISKTYPAYIVLVVFLVISYFVWDFFSRQVEEDRLEVFDKATSSVMARFDQEYNSCLTVLNSQRKIYDLMPYIVRNYFVLYGSVPTNTYDEIISLMYVYMIEKNEIEDFEFYVQSAGYFYYKVHPVYGQDTLFPVQFMVPEVIPTQEDNTELLAGFDMGTKPNVLEAMAKSRDKNIVTATNVFTLREPDTTGFYMISPIFPADSSIETVERKRELFEGMIFLEVDSELFFQNALGDGVPTDTAIVFQVFEVTDNNAQNKIFESANYGLISNDFEPYLSEEMTFKIADRDVAVRFSTIPGFGGSFQSVLPTLSLVISLFLSFLLFGFVLSVTTSRARAVDLADRMTRSQRRIVDSSQDIIAVLGMDGVWKSMNPASLNIFGYEPDVMIGDKIDKLFINDKDKSIFKELLENSQEEFTQRLDFRMKTKDEEFIWINWSFTISRQDNLIYCIGRDVTLQKLAELRELVRRKQIQLSNQLSTEDSERKSYFMTKMSHKLRNDLTSIIGYLQLISNKVYDSEEELVSYAEMSEESSEEMLSFVTSDLIEVALGESDGYKKLNELNFKDNFDIAFKNVRKDVELSGKIEIEFMDNSSQANVVVEKQMLQEGISALIKALIASSENIRLDINVEENPNEGATEIQILTGPNDLAAKMIALYNEHINNITEYLDKDQEDIMLNLSIAASMSRVMHGNMKVETMGKDGNLVQLTLPLTNPENLM
jgi:PAS domain S-box-containing protein